MTQAAHREWYSRDYLPHFDHPGLVQAITFRLADALPAEKLRQWQQDLAHESELVRDVETKRRIEAWIDAGHGACWLREDSLAQIVEDALLHFDAARYRLLAWCIMPNHVHVLIETQVAWPLGGIVHSWKTWTAKQINAHLGRSGTVWQREYHDRFIRDADHLTNVTRYIEQNPVKAGLCGEASDWRWSSVGRKRER
ncbi:REP-associated tyrosine transposase [Prosthecobacter vanneervenii]|uniref:REP element-mobilizing transposase RayT n=1 Tax=Prosthecobacter vanneervenii TaxID=48466 RepID=A0A7W8DIS9_9BACT|nr:transposase [Prosthecobacter vanneervenii]MBB5031383.1 REP element-mobilizing transposase RayT [Prosthecobacter vanneervenii]